jgi:hypothetical protein
MPVKQRYCSDFRRVRSSGAIGGFDGYVFTLTFFQESMRYPEESWWWGGPFRSEEDAIKLLKDTDGEL